MKKIMNGADDFVRETMEGIVAAYGNQVALLDGDFRVLVANRPASGPPARSASSPRAAADTCPCSWATSARACWTGCAVGEVFASPSADEMTDMIRTCKTRVRVSCACTGNYNGDQFNFAMVLARRSSSTTSRPPDHRTRRRHQAPGRGPNAEKGRGVAGLIYVFKVAGAAAEKMLNLDEVTGITQRTLDNVRTMGVALLSPCIVPWSASPRSPCEDGQIETRTWVSMAKAGIEVRPTMTADEIATVIVDTITADLPLAPGDEVSVMVNGLGATPLEEQFIVYRAVHGLLSERCDGRHPAHWRVRHVDGDGWLVGQPPQAGRRDSRIPPCPASTPFYTNANKQVATMFTRTSTQRHRRLHQQRS